jgi:hypothetical protein
MTFRRRVVVETNSSAAVKVVENKARKTSRKTAVFRAGCILNRVNHM